MKLSKRSKAVVRQVWNTNVFEHTLTNLRFYIYIRQRNINIQSMTKHMHRIYNSTLSWQEKAKWLKNIIENKNKYPRESYEYYMIVFNGDEEKAREKVKQKADKVKGKNNPAYNHGGRLSPFSKKFFKGDISEQTQLKARTTMTENESYNTKFSYWMKKTNNDENLAKKLLNERQSTFSLKKCIKKYGEELGKKIWEERQIKWQQKFKEKSFETMADINSRKASKINYEMLWKNNINSKGILYFIIWKDTNNLKIGITSKTVEQRLQKENRKYELILTYEDTISKCFEMEQYILRKHKKMKVLTETSTECFYISEMDNIIKTIDEIGPLSYEEIKRKLRDEFIKSKKSKIC